jgi:hypothetical protein
MIDGHDAQVRLVIDWLAGFSSHRSRQNKNLNGYEMVELGQDKQFNIDSHRDRSVLKIDGHNAEARLLFDRVARFRIF